MVLPMFLLVIEAVFITQLVFCFCARRLWIKLLPVGLAAAGSLLCWGLYFFGTFSEVYGGDFAAFAYGIVLLIVTGMAGLAWGVYGLVTLAKRK